MFVWTGVVLKAPCWPCCPRCAWAGLGELLREAKLALKKSKRVDYYAVLEVEQSAGEDAIKKAYRKAALKSHPDKVWCFSHPAPSWPWAVAVACGEWQRWRAGWLAAGWAGAADEAWGSGGEESCPQHKHRQGLATRIKPGVQLLHLD
jgi:hypothetical protein